MTVVTLAVKEPVPSIVTALESLLVSAKSGELRELAYAADLGATGVQTWASSTDNFAAQLGLVARLMYKINCGADQTAVRGSH